LKIASQISAFILRFDKSLPTTQAGKQENVAIIFSSKKPREADAPAANQLGKLKFGCCLNRLPVAQQARHNLIKFSKPLTWTTIDASPFTKEQRRSQNHLISIKPNKVYHNRN